MMPKYRVDWTEYRFAYIDAEDADTAIEIAESLEEGEDEFGASTDYEVTEVLDAEV